MTLFQEGQKMSRMFSFLAGILTQIYNVWPSYAGSIIIFTLIFMIIMTPVTIRQTKSMLAMQRLAPETKKLRQKYGNDRDKLNQEMMALYQANNVNPLGGCLPLLVQSPVFLCCPGVNEKSWRFRTRYWRFGNSRSRGFNCFHRSYIQSGMGRSKRRSLSRPHQYNQNEFLWIGSITKSFSSFNKRFYNRPSLSITGDNRGSFLMAAAKTDTRAFCEHDEPAASDDYESHSVHVAHILFCVPDGPYFLFHYIKYFPGWTTDVHNKEILRGEQGRKRSSCSYSKR